MAVVAVGVSSLAQQPIGVDLRPGTSGGGEKNLDFRAN